MQWKFRSGVVDQVRKQRLRGYLALIDGTRQAARVIAATKQEMSKRENPGGNKKRTGAVVATAAALLNTGAAKFAR